MEIYLDDAASTCVKGSVLKAMMPYFSEEYANPSSSHHKGEEARAAIEKARSELAKEINARVHELIFNSSVSESNNLALQGLAASNKKKKIIVSSIEHASIMEVCSFLESQGKQIVKIPVTREGKVDLTILEKAIDNQTLLVSIMHVNNVIGTIQDITSIARLCKRKGVLFHTDAAQSFGKYPIDVRQGIDLLSASSHKMGGPKGASFLYVREGITLRPLIFGGGQERGLRGGTENVPAIVGFASALQEIKKVNFKKIETLRDKLIRELERMGGTINGGRERAHGNVHVSFKEMNGDQLVAFLSKKGVYISRGSACESKNEKEDHVLRAIGLGSEAVRGSVRITLNEETSEKDLAQVVSLIKKALGIFKIGPNRKHI